MLADFYEFTMSNGYFINNVGNRICYFDLYFRDVPDNGGFAVMAGTQQVIEYIRSLKFTPEDIAVLELSSFQLHSMHCRPDTAVITNLSPNHLDVHPSFEDYANAKKSIWLQC